MSFTVDWPDFAPDPIIKIDITSGVLTLIAPSKLLNFNSYRLNGDVKGAIYKNGAFAAKVIVNPKSGVLSIEGGSVGVAQNDTIEVRLTKFGRLSLPWYTHVKLERKAFLTVPSGNTQITFDQQINRMPVPNLRLGFGWDANNAFKLGVVADASDGATQSMTAQTRLYGVGSNGNDQVSSTAINLGTTSTQTHTSNVTKSNLTDDLMLELELFLKSGTGTTRQEERVRVWFESAADVPMYPNFPTVVQLEYNKAGGGVHMLGP